METADTPSFVVNLDTAAEFLDYIRPSKKHWLGGVSAKLRWVFRGQKDSAWEVIPSAWRSDLETIRNIELLSWPSPADRLIASDVFLDRCPLSVPPRIVQANRQSESELNMLQEFLGHVNVVGLPFPHDTIHLNLGSLGFVAVASDFACSPEFGMVARKSPFFDRALEAQVLNPDPDYFAIAKELGDLTGFYPDRKSWPYLTNFTMKHSIAALAQHHGIPTRLLDWSYDALKATYFGCRSVAASERLIKERRIALYGINPFMIDGRGPTEQELFPHIDDPLTVELFLSQHSIFTEKNQTTSYLAAQEGLFTYPKYADLFYSFTGCYPNIVSSILKMEKWNGLYSKQLFPIRDYLRKITLPFAEVDTLLEMLDDERIFLTSLMPSLDRMKEGMLERALRKERLGAKITTPGKN
jgi:hypothetical protein